ncbi:sigma-70 family RNA polymerase sigma factor [Treponema zioleckii]|uniref:sigma-70 family RNA polymerase sigma factor n=1 Tax=Treponema zioleckii TaxID=331680 RepID=UPI00168ADA76|nr:RNA polymerase sigma factor RpoD/SigA [Treponema zioleckii]
MKDDIFSIYMAQVGKIPLLSADEETELLKKASKGDVSAKNRIVESNLRFVVKIARDYLNRGLDFEDLVNEGNAGLMTAVDHFDPSMNVRFITYAVWWIRQTISKAVNEKGRMIRLPLNKVNELVQIEKVRKILGTEKSEDEIVSEVSKLLNMKESRVRDLLASSRSTKSLDAPKNNDDASDGTFGELLADERYAVPEEEVMNRALHSEIESALKTLKPREEKVIRLRYGLNGDKPKSLKEIGDICGLTKERIRQIEKNAITTLRMPSRSRRLEGFVA